MVGAGGREHALAWRLARDPSVDDVLAAPGNPGIARDASCHDIASDDADGLLALVERERVDLTVVGPEGPLVAGLADELSARGHAVFGPSAEGARLEGSKAWAKDLCERYGIPAAGSLSAGTMTEALGALDAFGPPYVVKADGLAAGKGVVITEERDEAVRALERALVDGEFGDAGSTVVVEEHLSGREVSAFALADGSTALPLGFAQDFKRIGDDDAGPNTGGMGAYSPCRSSTSAMADRDPHRDPRADRPGDGRGGRPVPGGPVRGSDADRTRPDGARVQLPVRRPRDPGPDAPAPVRARRAAARVRPGRARERARSTWCPGRASPSSWPRGATRGRTRPGSRSRGSTPPGGVEGATVFHSGTAERQGRVVTAGGRVLSISATGPSIAEARDRAYEAAARVSFEGMRHRTDIAALAAKEERT